MNLEIILIVIVVLGALAFFLNAGGFLLAMAGYEEIRFDMKNEYTGVEAKLVTEPNAGFSERYPEARCSGCSTVTFHLQAGEKIKYIEWNTDQTSSATVWLHYVVSEPVIIDKDGNKRPIPQPVCSYGEKRCSGMVLQGCSADGTAWEDIEACTYGCDSGVLMCNIAPDEPPVPPPEDGLPYLAIFVIGAIAAVSLLAWKIL